MKEFILRARKATTRPDFDIDNLPKEGKMDSVCASISNALWLSGDIRKDTIMHVVLEGPYTGPKAISFFGNEIRGLRSDERSIAEYVKAALQKGSGLGLNEEARVRTGVKVAKKSFERLLWERSGNQVIVLDKGGKDVREFSFGKNFTVVFGSVEGLPPKTIGMLDGMKAEKVSLGPRTLFAAHCPIIVHNELDRHVRIRQTA